jgi:hypothetical protein
MGSRALGRELERWSPPIIGYLRSGRPVYQIAGGDGTGDGGGSGGSGPGGDGGQGGTGGDGGGSGGSGGSGGGDGGQGGGGNPPTLEAMARAAVDKLDRGERLTEAELGALKGINAELTRARKEAGDHRGESKKEREAREKAEKDRNDLIAALSKFTNPEGSGGSGGGQGGDPAKDKEAREAAEKAARLEAENRTLKLQSMFDRVATTKGVDAELAWAYLSGRFGDVDLAKEDDAKKAIGDAIDKALKDKPSLKLGQRYPGQGGGDAGSGGGGEGSKRPSLSGAISQHYSR